MSTISGVREVKDALDKWYEATNRKQITLVTAGRSGVGKSTLISNMLRLEGDAAPKRRHGPSSTTKEVKLYTSSVNGIEVRIIDTPGLTAADVSEAKIITGLQAESGGKADMLLYCVSLLPNSKIDEQDAKIIKTLKTAFGPDIWSHAILVLTFANYVIRDLDEGITLKDLVTDYAAKFQSVLQSQCPSFSVCSIFSCDQEQTKRDPTTMITLLAGLNPDKELVEGVKWDESIYMEVLKKCSPDAIPALLKVREPTSNVIMLAVRIGRDIGVTALACAPIVGIYIPKGALQPVAKMIASGGKYLDEQKQLKKLRKDMERDEH